MSILRTSKLPPLFYGALYLLLIPTFAIIYSFIWQDFFQSTSRYERSTRAVEMRVRRLLQTELTSWFEKYGHQSEVFHFNDLEVYGLSVEGESVTFVSPATFSVRPYRSKVAADMRSDPALIMRVFDISWRISSSRSAPASPVDVYLTGIPIEMAQHLYSLDRSGRGHWGKLKGALLLPVPSGPKPLEAGIEGELALSYECLRTLRQWGEAQNGFPEPVEGGFTRFFYFSTVTITTLGYGDIVPLTDRARLFVASESILGVMLAGLFLNSVASHRAKAR